MSSRHPNVLPASAPSFAGASALRACVAGCLLAGGWLVAGLAQAERADRDQPLSFDAGQLRIDGKRKLQLLSGGVEITRGTLVLKAAQVELRETPGGQLVVAQGSEAQPATFRQKRDGVDETIEGQALRIEYDTQTQTVQFSQKAEVRVIRAGVLADQISGQTIVYDHARDAFDIQGGAADSSGTGRVRGVVTPRTPRPAGDAR